jgi:TetR/AcrR family transcriptional regulator, transcriptional repressor for nem operon
MSTPDSPTRPRGRPPAFDRVDVLDRLLGLFWHRGYEAATQELMLQVSGLSSSSLYRAFGTKAQLFTAVLDRYLDLADDMLGPMENGVAGGADLRRFLDRVQGQIEGPGSPGGCLVVTTLGDPINADPRIADLTDRHLRRMREAILRTLIRGQERGERLVLGTPDAQADAVFAGVLGVLARADADPGAAVRMLGGVRRLVPVKRRD